MSTHTLIDSDQAAVALAKLLNSSMRGRPTAVVTIAAGQREPYVDVHDLADQLDGLVDVYLVATGPHTWTFSSAMRGGTQVYGGAGRVYPVGHAWVDDLSASPLRFAWSGADGQRATEQLIDDGLDMAAAAGLLGNAAPSSTTSRRQGVVRRVDVERAWVDFGGGGLDMGIVPPQLAEPDLPIERVLQPGMVVTGVMELRSRWFDVRESRLGPVEALAAYQVGQVVLARVGAISQGAAVAQLLPGVAVELARADVAADVLDLRTLLTLGEVVAARVLATAPWRLTLLDVDEEPVPAASIYAGGPPWLLAPVETAAVFDHETELSRLLAPAPPRAQTVVPDPEPVPRPEAPVAAATPVAPVVASRLRPTPAMMPRARGLKPHPSPPAAAPATAARARRAPEPAAPWAQAPEPGATGAKAPEPGVRVLSLKVSELESGARGLRSSLAELQNEVLGLRHERDQLQSLKSEAERRAERFEAELKKSRIALRKAKSGQPAASPVFADRERHFRYLVETAWASRIPVGEQAARPLPEFDIGGQFLDSLEFLQGVSEEKVAGVVMELVTGVAETSAGRDLHRLRTGEGGDDAARHRPADGAVCWRVALQTSTPSARRLHAWKLPHGRWEISSIRKHDDFAP